MALETADITEYIVAFIQDIPVLQSNEQQRDVHDALSAYIKYVDSFEGDTLRYYDAVFYPNDSSIQERIVELRATIAYSTISTSLIRGSQNETVRLILLSLLRGTDIIESLVNIFSDADIQIYIDAMKRTPAPALMFFGDVKLMLTDREFLDRMNKETISAYFGKTQSIYDDTLASLWSLVLNDRSNISLARIEYDRTQRKLQKLRLSESTYTFLQTLNSRPDQAENLRIYLRVLALDNMDNVLHKSRSVINKITQTQTSIDALGHYIELYDHVVTELKQFMTTS